MGIKCSLFGHDFGETTVERDREEQGNEVVSTIREIETCARCGETRIVSENTEVTTIKTPDDVSMEEEDAEADSAADAETEIVDAEAGEPVADADTPTTDLPGDDEEFESAAEDDGVILEDDTDEELDREPGEWPESAPPDESDQTDTEPAGRTVAQSDETEEPADTALPSDGMADDESSTDDDAAVWSETDPDLERAEADVERTESGAETVTDATFRCTECGFTTPVDSSSLREGDYCPECHQGMLSIETA